MRTDNQHGRRYIRALNRSVGGGIRRLLRRESEYSTPPFESSGKTGSPVFIGGTGRCGTWAVGRMIGQDDTVATVYTELRFHSVPKGFRAVLSGSMSPDEFADSVLEKWYNPSGGASGPKGLQLIVTRPELVASLDRFRDRGAEDVPMALGRLMRELVDPYAFRRDAERWAETTPDNVSAAGALTRVFPTARVIHMVRDGRDAAASVANVGWGPSTVEDGLEWWGRRMRAAQLGVGASAPSSVLTIRLEELIYFDRDRSFERLTNFLNVNSAPVKRYFDDRMNAEAGHLGRWQRGISTTQLDHINGRYRELLDELGEVGTPSLPIDPERVDEVAGSSGSRVAGDNAP